MKGAESGHDWWHIQRVLNNARLIASEEQCNLQIIELGALLHDIADWKFAGDEFEGPKQARLWLESINTPIEIIDKVCHIVENVSFKGAGVQDKIDSIEGKIVQDADRLDSLGAIGIGRCFSYGGYRQREMYDPEVKPTMHSSFEEYKKNQGTTINHFYEKLLLLKDRMNTKTGKKVAESRTKYMEQFLEQFLKEWNGQA